MGGWTYGEMYERTKGKSDGMSEAWDVSGVSPSANVSRGHCLVQ